MNARELEVLWAQLPTGPVTGLLAAERLGAAEAWAALDADGHCHLLVEVPAGSEAPAMATKGLRAWVGEHQVADGEARHFLDLSCLDSSLVGTFATVAADILETAASLPPDKRLAGVSATLERWQWFWAVDARRLSESDALGLFAELWFLIRWAGVTPENIAAWTATDGSRHDFQWPALSVEVKATARTGDRSTIHTISSLDQLADPESGRLLLFSLRVARDQLAGNNLPKLVDQIRSRLTDHPQIRESFLQKIARRGYSPAHRKSWEVPYRIVNESLFSVDGEFPRITRASFPNGLPGGVVALSYSLDMEACAPWRIDASPDTWPHS
ncbi:PD-(D/E)XK motif protein [Kitasatospora sp. NPDC052896]|uniref:PD-(D/E)XK motif protein n=1 Tax=Kitasatospora sp. NPDC052896 TaxID=3364061 RepID=UPI0037C6C724